MQVRERAARGILNFYKCFSKVLETIAGRRYTGTVRIRKGDKSDGF